MMFAVRGLALAIPVILGGCGLWVPEKDFFTGDTIVLGEPSSRGRFENRIVAHIRCEIRNAVYDTLRLPNVDWLRTWGATVNLKLTVEEQSAIAPSVTFNPIFFHASSFSLGVGGSGSAHSTRLETIEFTYDHAELLDEARKNIAAGIGLSCDKLQDGVMIQSDLKIEQFLYDKASISSTGEATSKAPNTPPFSTLQDDITFVLAVGGTANPIWKLSRVSVDTGSTLLGATRTRTDHLLLTFGPVVQKAKGGAQAQLSPQTQQVHNAGLIGGSTAQAIQSLAH